MPRPALTAARRAVYDRAQRHGLTPFHLRLATSLTRPVWMLRAGLPAGPLRFTEPVAPDAADVALAARLITAFHLAIAGLPGAEGQPEGMWGWIFEHRQQALAEALERRDADALAALLTTMFRSDFVVGMATGSLFGPDAGRLSDRVFRLTTLDGLVSLAESLGVVATENPEQGSYGRALRGGVDELVARIEAELGISIAFPRVGAPYGVALRADEVLSTEEPEQVEAAVRLVEIADAYLPDRARDLKVLEIGAGYGGMATWFLALRPQTAAYTIVDLPIVNVIHGYFLGRALGAERVSFLGEPHAQVRIVPDHRLDAVEAPVDIVVNKDSFPEMPEEAMLEYLRWGRAHCTGLLFSFNHEAATEFEGSDQNLVPAGIARTGGYRRVERRPSWVRRGYVQEVYLADPRPSEAGG